MQTKVAAEFAEMPPEGAASRFIRIVFSPMPDGTTIQVNEVQLLGAPVRGAAYRLEVHRAGYHADDAYTAYLEMGSPKQLTIEQLAKLNDLTRDLPETDKIVDSGKFGTAELSIQMNSNEIVLVTLMP